jgi:hypothetical protein
MTLVAYPLVFLVCRRLLLRAPPQHPSLSRCGWDLILESLRLPLHGLSSHLALEVVLFLFVLSESHIGANHGRLLVVIVQVLLLEDLTLLGLVLDLNLLVIVLIAYDLFLNE